MKTTLHRWAIKHRSLNMTDGKREYFDAYRTTFALFLTRRDAKEHIEEHFGYIKNRPDLRAEPHGWKMPVAVKVILTISEEG